ncbi:hypothetical protein R6242_22105 [Iodobacter sp. CM08]|uniref:hypothetical protein n=1 Tax=Iodobacter sp. CM08 TaxID=3085902 RepID=UPI0029825D47|nr:hypothetical protein [Iodobacter sp. CM08]MDW5419270.1 hypothetical protein [Iodobacter sp. CM08]
MSWEDTFKIFLSALTAMGGASIIIFAMSSWLGKVWASRILERDRLKYTTVLEDLKTQNQISIDKLNSSLEAANLKLTIAYGGIFEKQSNAILELYSKLLELELGANPRSLTEAQKWNDYKDQIREAANFYHKQRILIPKSLDEKILKAIEEAHAILAESTSGHTPAEFAHRFSEAKNIALFEMRKLLSVTVYSEPA